MRRIGTVVVLLLIILTAASQPAAADGSSASNSRRIRLALKIIDQFNQRVADVYDDLQKNTRRSNRRARKHCQELLGDFMETLHDNSFAPRFFGYVLLFRAIAEYRLGRERDAIWYWGMAQDVLPELRRKTFGNFPDVEEFLLNYRVENGDDKDHVDSSEAEELGIRAPRPLHTPMPQFPRAANVKGFTGTAQVECRIEVDGTTTHPRLVRSSGSTAADVSALLALKDWRFEPASVNGSPAACIWRLTVRFKRH